MKKQFNEKGYLLINGKALTPWSVVKIKTMDQIESEQIEKNPSIPAIEGSTLLIHTPYEQEFPYIRYCAAGMFWFDPDLIDEVVGTPEEVTSYDLPRMEKI